MRTVGDVHPYGMIVAARRAPGRIRTLRRLVVVGDLGHRDFIFRGFMSSLLERKRPPMTPERAADARTPLVVDLDGTLLRTDTLLESFASNLFSRPLDTAAALLSLPKGREAFKARLVEIAPLDCTALPAREPLVAHLEAEKAGGRSLHLVTAAHQSIADSVAERFGLFDSVHGSRDGVNLKGKHKLERLQGLFPQGFAYAGDSGADLHVWQGADSIVLAGASASVAGRARRLGKPVEMEFDHQKPSLRTWRKGLRLHQWAKNVLIFVPLALSPNLDSPHAIARCAAGFLLIGIAASATYLLNDLADLNSDRRHATKRRRPLASGELPLSQALVAAPFMLIAALVGALLLSPPFALALVFYIAITLSYSFKLKRIALLDVVVLAALYTIRLVMGTVLSQSNFSPWLLTFSGFFFFAMSLAKRHVEVSTASGPANVNIRGRGYRPADAPLTLALGVASSVASILVVVQYMMAEAFPSNVYRAPAALWAAPVLLTVWVCRIWLLAHRGELDDDPVAFAVKDRISIGLGVILAAMFALARYL
jgi:4-hydroxybenzoate polyprenyltransferase